MPYTHENPFLFFYIQASIFFQHQYSHFHFFFPLYCFPFFYLFIFFYFFLIFIFHVRDKVVDALMNT